MLLDKIMGNGKAGEPALPQHVPADERLAKDHDVAWFKNMVRQAALVGVQTEMHRLTPTLAEYLLADTRNPMNRSVSANKATEYARDIEEGRWRFNGEPLIISRDGFLNDGQHRCVAVIEAGASLEFLWVFGVTRESRTTLDQGRIRTAGDYLKMDGKPYGNSAARVGAIVMQVEKSGACHDGPGRPTKTAVVDYVKAHPDVVESCGAVPMTTKAIGGHSALAAAHCLISRKAEPEPVDDFFHRLVTGEDLTARDPILICRTRLTNMVLLREKTNQRLECVIRGWNNYRSRKRVRSLNIVGGQLPQIAA